MYEVWVCYDRKFGRLGNPRFFERVAYPCEALSCNYDASRGNRLQHEMSTSDRSILSAEIMPAWTW